MSGRLLRYGSLGDTRVVVVKSLAVLLHLRRDLRQCLLDFAHTFVQFAGLLGDLLQQLQHLLR